MLTHRIQAVFGSKILGVIIIVFVCVLTPRFAYSAPLQPNIVILNSYTRDMQWTDNQVQGIMTTYKEAGLEPNFYIEYLDWKRNPSKENLSLLYQLFKVKYSKQVIDVIMTTDDAALEFALNYRAELFSDAPIVYSGVDPDSAWELTRGRRKVAGVQEVLDVNGTLAVMKNFNPDIRKVYLIYDNTESGLAAKGPLERAVGNLNPKVSVELLNNDSYQEIVEKLQTAPDDSAALMATYSRDRAGVVMELERYVQLFSKDSRIPIYVFYDFEMGHGAIGGSVISGFLQGKSAAQQGVRILNGEHADIVSVRGSVGHEILLDYEQIQRYQLPMNSVPADSTLINSPRSFYEQNKRVIWITVAIFFFMAMSIVILVLNIRQRRAAEANLKLSNEELAATYEEAVASQEELQTQYEQLGIVQQELFVSEERYKLSIDGANDGFWDWDIRAEEVFFSDRCCTLLGLTTNRIKSTMEALSEIICPDSMNTAFSKLEEHLSGESTYFVSELKIHAGKEEKWVLARGKALFEGRRPVRMAGSLTDITEQKADAAKINYLAYHDPLTGLWNRAALSDQIRLILQTDTPSRSGAILFIDIDNFKFVNDTFGHSFGDKLLVVIGHKLNDTVESAGFIARMGGDEFVILLTDIGDRTEAARCAELIAEIVKRPLQIDGNKVYITFSIGVTMFPEDGASVEELQKNADFAMYQAKEQGKSRYMFFNHSMETALREKVLLERNLREAILNNELKLWYQPFIEVATGKIIGFEALLRWYSPENGVLPPGNFINLAEKTGLIIPIGRKVIQDACCFIAALCEEGYANLLMTINISAIQLIADDFIPSVQEIIKQTGVAPSVLGFEITESVFMEQSKGLIDKLKSLKDMGITILLDDFGSGYSSLKYLNHLPIDVVKIDKTFIDRLNEVGDNKQLAEIIIALAHQINAKVVAEGVETENQLQKLLEYQCELVQGYLFSRPVPEAAVRSLLMSESDWKQR